jgi:hypothetical protein
MVKANQPSSIAEWPSEGLPLKEAAIRLGNAALLDAWSAAAARLPSFRRQWVGIRYGDLTEDESRRIAASNQARNSCFSPLLESWNAGELICMGRRGDRLAMPTLIPPPVVGWTFRVASLERSIIYDPGKTGKIFDLRFLPKDCVTVSAMSPGPTIDVRSPNNSPEVLPASATTESASAPGAKMWLQQAVERLKSAPNAPKKITDAARLLETEMKAAVAAGKCIKALKWTTIITRLREWNLWPSRGRRGG